MASGTVAGWYVASRTLDRVTWNNWHLLEGDVAEEVAKLKTGEGGEIQVYRSGDLLQPLLRRDFIDTLRIWRFPVVLGTGKRLFGEGTIPRRRLTRCPGNLSQVAGWRSREFACAPARSYRGSALYAADPPGGMLK